MPKEVLPGKLVTPTRDELIRRFERDYQLRVPGAKVGPSTEPGIKARIVADQLLPLYGEAARIAQTASLEDMDGPQLEDEAESLGLPRRIAATGASGGVTIVASSGGGTIFAGDEIKNTLTGLRYACTVTNVYTNGSEVPVSGIDTGSATNVVAGTILKWTSPRPSIAQDAVITTQTDGSGLTGGRNLETDEEIVVRIRDARANPAVAGNDAAYRAAALATPNVGLQAAFTFPCIAGPGTTALAFTMRPSAPGASRIPNATQIAAVRAHVIGQFPKDDGLLSVTLVAQPVVVIMRVDWLAGTPGWTDIAKWPAYDAQPVYVSAATSPTVFTLHTALVAPTAPMVGQTIALYDAANAKFQRKKILTITDGGGGAGNKPWVITCDTSNFASDTTFQPTTGTDVYVSPWSDSLDSLVAPLVAYFDTLGPGEQKATFFDAGSRERRSPPSPSSWPSILSGRMATSLYSLPSVADLQLMLPTLPYATTIGSPGSTAYLLQLSRIAAYPLT